MLKYLFTVICSLLFLNGCAIAPIEPLSNSHQQIPGIRHKVIKGQTLWRISKIYGIDINELIRINRIPDTAIIEVGQIIIIPEKQNAVLQTQALNQEEFCWPLKGKITGAYGQTIKNIINKGINIEAGRNANVVASRSGKTVFMSPSFGSFGKTIIIDHGDGYSSLYAGNSEVYLKPGDQVLKGKIIAKIENTSGNKNNYLHFQIRKGYQPQNPNFYLP